MVPHLVPEIEGGYPERDGEEEGEGGGGGGEGQEFSSFHHFHWELTASAHQFYLPKQNISVWASCNFLRNCHLDSDIINTFLGCIRKSTPQV